MHVKLPTYRFLELRSRSVKRTMRAAVEVETMDKSQQLAGDISIQSLVSPEPVDIKEEATYIMARAAELFVMDLSLRGQLVRGLLVQLICVHVSDE